MASPTVLPKKETPDRVLRISDLICSVSGAALCGLQVILASGPPSWSSATDISGVLFILIALTYRGSYLSWWTILGPSSLLFLMAPIAHWEMSGAIHTPGGLMRAALTPGFAFIAGALLITARHMRTRSIEGSGDMHQLRLGLLKNLRIVRAMKHSLSDIVRKGEFHRHPVVTEEPYVASEPALNWETQTFTIEEGQLVKATESEVISYFDIKNLVSREMEALAESRRHKSGIRVNWSFPGLDPQGSEGMPPLAARGSQRDLQTVLRGLLQVAAASFGESSAVQPGLSGVIRLTLRPTLSTLQFLIEDNGRGLSEQMMSRISPGDEPTSGLSYSEIREMIREAGWKIDRQSRLGVGSRMTLELPRADSSPRHARQASDVRKNEIQNSELQG